MKKKVGGNRRRERKASILKCGETPKKCWGEGVEVDLCKSCGIMGKFCLKMDVSVYCLKLKNNVQGGFSGPIEMLCIIWRERERF